MRGPPPADPRQPFGRDSGSSPGRHGLFDDATPSRGDAIGVGKDEGAAAEARALTAGEEEAGARTGRDTGG